MRWLSSYLQHDSRDTQYSNRVHRTLIDEFSAIHHGEVMVLRSFVGCVMSCKSTLYVGTIQKTICAPARQLEYSLSEIVLFSIVSAAYPTVRSNYYYLVQSAIHPIVRPAQ
jgi:hypothetical protein